MGDPLVIIEHFTKKFSDTLPPAIQDINATLSKGTMTCLVGPDGSGKTTLIRLLAGLLTPTSGRATIAGYDTLKDAPAIHLMTGYMPQRFGLYEELTVLQNLNLYAELRGIDRREKEETIQKLLRFTSLKPFIGRLARALSGGMKQKLGLACALIKKPTLLLLDEPTVGVDPVSRKELWTMVRDLLEEGISVVWSTAYLNEAEKSDLVLLLSEGKLLYCGKPNELLKRVEGRVWTISPGPIDKRKLLFQLLQKEQVLDGTVQGKDVRIVLKAGVSIDALSLLKETSASLCSPRFEDAFIEILGGGPGGASKLAELTPLKEDGQREMILAQHLTKKFGQFVAVQDISFAIAKGEIFGLLGPNGAGKSTTFKMLCGLLTPTEGTAHVGGKDLQIAPADARARIGYMAQKFSLYGNLSVNQNLQFFAGIYNLQGKEKKQAVATMIEIFDLSSYLSFSAESLPLGFKQRLALACATMHSPDVLFLDEPTSGVDPITRREFWNHINGLVTKGVTIMVTTHFMDEAEYCDRIAMIYQGKMIHMDTPDALKAQAKSENTPQPTLEDAFLNMIETYDTHANQTNRPTSI